MKHFYSENILELPYEVDQDRSNLIKKIKKADSS